jgi:hypothetical protein
MSPWPIPYSVLSIVVTMGLHLLGLNEKSLAQTFWVTPLV